MKHERTPQPAPNPNDAELALSYARANLEAVIESRSHGGPITRLMGAASIAWAEHAVKKAEANVDA